MRKWVLVALAVCAVATTATAGAAPPAGVHRDPVGVPMFANWYDPSDPGGWYVVDATGALSGPHDGAVAADEPVMIDIAWAGQAYGHTKVIPDVDRLRLTISRNGETVVAQSWAEGRSAWTPVFVWDQYWVDLLGPAPPFNPNLGTGAYGIKWENVFPAGFFSPGSYDVRIDEAFAHSYNDLTAYPDWGARPVRYPPYTASYEFSFVVA